MEKAILKTLIYADIFDYPLKTQEIHRWLIEKKATFRQVEKTLESLYKVSSIKYYGKYYFLPRRNKLVNKRFRRERQSLLYFRKAKILSQALKIIPWIKLVGVSGGLAMKNAGKKDDIDLLIVTSKNRLWISRLLAVGLFSFTGQRRKKTDSNRKIAGKLCLNILLEEDKLEQINKDVFTAHEVLQMKPLWYRGGIYSKYLAGNEWAFKFLPNWITTSGHDLRIKNRKSSIVNHKSIIDYMENLAEKFQRWYMQSPKGLERIEDGALYFHPNDCRAEVLNRFKRRISGLNIGTP